MVDLMKRAVRGMPVQRLKVNPDYNLKTCRSPETKAESINMANTAT